MNIGTFEAKTRLSEILEEVQKGKEYTITKRGKAIAKIVPVRGNATSRRDIGAQLAVYRTGAKFDICKAIRTGRK